MDINNFKYMFEHVYLVYKINEKGEKEYTQIVAEYEANYHAQKFGNGYVKTVTYPYNPSAAEANKKLLEDLVKYSKGKNYEEVPEGVLAPKKVEEKPKEKEKPKTRFRKIKKIVSAVLILNALGTGGYFIHTAIVNAFSANNGGVVPPTPTTTVSAAPEQPAAEASFLAQPSTTPAPTLAPTLAPTVSAADKFNKYVTDMNDQVSKEDGIQITKGQEGDIVQFLMGYYPDDVTASNFVDLIDTPLNSMLKIDVIPANNNGTNVEKLEDARTPIGNIFKSLENISESDRQFADYFLNEREAILDAIYSGDQVKASELSQKMYKDVCIALIARKPIEISAGKFMAVGSLNVRTLYVTSNLASKFMPILKIYNNSVTYDASLDLNGSGPENFAFADVEAKVSSVYSDAGQKILNALKNKTTQNCPEDIKQADMLYHGQR